MTMALSQEQALALDVARGLALAGVPVFVAAPDASASTGFSLPSGWQHLTADPSAVDHWQPGMALCAVMGHGLDVIDVDPRNGGDPTVLGGAAPVSYGLATTPSGGLHSFIASLGVAKHTGVLPGIDVQAGAPDGAGRGFVFLAPTVRASKITGEPAAYHWAEPLDLARLQRDRARDTSGAELAAMISALRGTRTSTRAASTAPDWYRRFLESREPQAAAAADSAIATKLDAVRTWTPAAGSNFRDVLQAASLTLGGYVGGDWLDEHDARTRLEEATAAVWGNLDDRDHRWITDGLRDGVAAPFHVFTPEDEARYGDAAQQRAGEGEAPPDPAPDWTACLPTWDVRHELGLAPGSFDPTGDNSDQGLAHVCLVTGMPVLRYAADAGLWVRRDERDVWVESKSTAAEGWLVSLLAEYMPAGQTPIPSDTAERSEEHWQAHRRGFFRSSAGEGRIGRKIRSLVDAAHPATLKLTDLDTNPDVLWAGGVPWDLRASTEVPTPAHWIDPRTPHLRTAACAPDPTVPTPRWDAFTAAVLPDPDLRAWTLRVLSIALTGHPDPALPVLYGRERSGKSSLVQMLIELLGSYGHAATPELVDGKNRPHPADVYELKGRRLAFIDEGPGQGHHATERIKQYTGGAMLSGAPKYGKPVSFKPTHTLVMTTNKEPSLTDPALRARLRLIPCDQPEDAVRPTRLALLGAGLRQEAPGILAALMREAGRYLADLDSVSMRSAPAAVRDLTDELAGEQDLTAQWMEARTAPEGWTKSTVLHADFAAWHQNHPAHRRSSVLSPQAFGRAMADLGVPRDRRRDGSWWQRSVMGGPGGSATPPPTAANFFEQTTRPVTPNAISVSPTTNCPGGGVADVDAVWQMRDSTATTSATPHNPRSGSVFSSSVADVADITSKEEEKLKREVERGTEKREVSTPTSATATDDLDSGKKSALTCSDDPVADVGASATASATGDNGPRTASPSPSVGGPVPPRFPASPRSTAALTPPARPEVLEALPRLAEPAAPPGAEPEVAKKAEAARLNREIARLHELTGVGKTDLRKEIKTAQKEAARLTAIAAAAGPVHALPAVVDRAGLVVPVDVDTAALIVRARLAATGGRLTIDVEHTGYPIGHADYALRTVQLGDAAAAVDFDPTDAAQAAAVRALIAEALVLHAHSATADLVPLAVAGLVDHDEAWLRMWDTLVLTKLADPALVGQSAGLKPVSATVLGDHAVTPAAETAKDAIFAAGKWKTDVETTDPVERSGWAQVEPGCETMIRYAGSDILDTHALTQVLPAPDPHVADRERLAQRMVNRGAYRGIRLDGAHVDRLAAEHDPARTALGESIAARWGVSNPKSGPQVAAKAVELGAALPRTNPSKTHPQGQPSAKAEVLEPLRDAPGELGEFAAAVLDWRHHDTVLNLFLRPYADLCHRGDGRARPTVLTMGARTGRMSCANPNLQQLPKKGGVRACITADPGQVIISADFSSVEIRMAAALSQDQTLLRMLAEGRDLHEEIALQVWGPDPEASAKAGRPAPLKANRYRAKGMTFGRIYGGGLETLSAQVGVPQHIGQQVLDTLDALTPQLKAFSRSVSEAARRGQTRFPSYSGRTIHLPQDTPHKSVNYAVQGSARELLIDALERWAQTPWGNSTLIPVHDELLAFVPAEDGEAATAALLECMTSELYGVPIVAEADAPTFAWQDST